jgi:hypothetical protein
MRLARLDQRGGCAVGCQRTWSGTARLDRPVKRSGQLCEAMQKHDGDQMTDTAAGEPPGAWLAIADAARSTGWNPERLRSLARRGTIASRRGNRGLEILVEQGRPRSLDGSPVSSGRSRDAPHAVASTTNESRRIAGLEAALEKLRDEFAQAERDASALRVDLARAEERVKAVEAVARGDVEAAKRIVEVEIAAKDEVLLELRAQLAREIARGDAVALELVALRRPWWRRLLGR